MGSQARNPWPAFRPCRAGPVFRVPFPLLLLIALLTALPPAGWANDRYAAIVVDAVSGEVLHQARADRRLHPASLTKMMTLYLTFQAVEDGRLSLKEKIPISRHAASQVPTRLGLRAGSSIRVEDAIYAVIAKSANDAAVALAEAIGGSVSGFVARMDRTARQLGMTGTSFRNPTGLPNRRQLSTARDMAGLARALLRDYPQYYAYFATTRWTYRGRTYDSTNRLMARYPGMDGLKTGYVRASGFNLAASAVRGNLRLIAVVFGGVTAASRDDHVSELMDWAFASPRGSYLVAYGSATFLPFRPPVPGRRPGLPAIAMEAGNEGTGQGSTGGATMVAADTVGAAAEDGWISAWGIQVGAFSSPAAGSRALESVSTLLPELTGSLRSQLAEVQTPRGPLFRARLVGLSHADAVVACRQLEAIGTPCLVVPPETAF